MAREPVPVLTFRLAEQLTHGHSPTFCDSNVLEHVNLLSLKFLMFLHSHQYAISFCSLMLFLPLLYLGFFVI